MKTQRNLTPILLALFLISCGTTANTVGPDPVVVDAQKVTSTALETFNTAFKVEAELRATGKVPDAVNAYFNTVRVNCKSWINTAEALTAAYQNNRNAQNKANLQTAIAVVTTALAQVNQYLTQLQG